VTSWGPAGIAKFARDAGFSRSQVVDAVALALAVSGGADHYAHNPISSPGAERRGLWAVRVDEVPGELVADLFSPHDAAAVARALFQATSDSFAWHPGWITGAAAKLAPMVELSLSGKGRRHGPLAAEPFTVHMAHLVAKAHHFGRALDAGQMPGA
jgi:hypothetical protein